MLIDPVVDKIQPRSQGLFSLFENTEGREEEFPYFQKAKRDSGNEVGQNWF